MKEKGAITDVKGIKVGHATDLDALTGCTVILCEEGAVGGVEVRGSASGTRGIDALSPFHIVQKVHGILLTGGSSFGLDAAGGVMEYLEERGIGFEAGAVKVPIVAAAVIFDLGLGDPKRRPDRRMGYEASKRASDGEVAEGSVGAGTGATVGKLYELQRASKGGLGTASRRGPGRLVVGALAVVNSFGDVLDPVTGSLLAGLRDSPSGRRLTSTMELLRKGIRKERFGTLPLQNTTLVVMATNASLTKTETTKLAQMASGGLFRTLSPYGSLFDGDVIFALSTGEVDADLHNIAPLAQEAVAEAVKRAVVKADGFGLLPAYRDLER